MKRKLIISISVSLFVLVVWPYYRPVYDYPAPQHDCNLCAAGLAAPLLVSAKPAGPAGILKLLAAFRDSDKDIKHRGAYIHISSVSDSDNDILIQIFHTLIATLSSGAVIFIGQAVVQKTRKYKSNEPQL